VLQRLHPKALPALTRLDMELKLNTGDLREVGIVSGDLSPEPQVGGVVVPLRWNFKSAEEIQASFEGRLVDVVGLVVHHGRWERELMTHSGGFWVRVWLVLSPGTPCRLYIDRQRWEGVSKALPGTSVILTNMRVASAEGGGSKFLDSGTETQVFTDMTAPRFRNEPLVQEALQSFRKDSFPSLSLGGGHHLFGSLKPNKDRVVSSRNSILEILEFLPFRTSYRLTVKGLLTEEVSLDKPLIDIAHVNCSICVTNRTDEEIRSLASSVCILSDDLSRGTVLCRSVGCLEMLQSVILMLEDCRLKILSYPSLIPNQNSLSEFSSHFTVDLFRYRPYHDRMKPWEGIESMLRLVSQEDSGDDSVVNESILVTTQDLLDGLS